MEMTIQRLEAKNTRETIYQQTRLAEHELEARYNEPDVFSVPEVRLQLGGGVVDHGTETVYAGAGQSTPNALLHYIKYIIHHAGGELALLVAVHGNSLQRKLSQCPELTE